MHIGAYCPHCDKAVSFEDRICPHCAGKLTKAKFALKKVVIGGLVGFFCALIVSAIIVPLALVLIVASLFARERLHVTRIDDDHDPDVTPVSGRVIETEGSSSPG